MYLCCIHFVVFPVHSLRFIILAENESIYSFNSNIWFYQRMLRIPWAEYVRYKVLRRIERACCKQPAQFWDIHNEERRLGEFKTQLSYWMQAQQRIAICKMFNKFEKIDGGTSSCKTKRNPKWVLLRASKNRKVWRTTSWRNMSHKRERELIRQWRKEEVT